MVCSNHVGVLAETVVKLTVLIITTSAINAINIFFKITIFLLLTLNLQCQLAFSFFAKAPPFTVNVALSRTSVYIILCGVLKISNVVYILLKKRKPKRIVLFSFHSIVFISLFFLANCRYIISYSIALFS
ncbi:hypothetical protein FLR06_11345 [Listeria monocytogenes]|nr:hypothetical protein [Listeria monocytogenes]ECB9517167.1 hypothetical protein [Listeria monocytogenes]ECB9523092.1 hypothetical protein [Listeria monocytogenes]ECB9528873.1 hypothetical protein [Listeria monocytogenes]TYV61371.1 hypothetical protein FZ055_07990 [Listeria monocytogenes]